MKAYTLIIATALQLATLASCTLVSGNSITASDNIISKSIDNISGFDEIEASADMHVIYTYGPDESIVIKAPDNIIDYISVKKHNDKLTVATKSHTSLSYSDTNHPIIYVTSPSVKEFSASACATIDIIGTPNTTQLELDAQSSGTINATDLSVKSISIEASSNGSINIRSIKAQSAEIEAASNATINIDIINAGSLELESASNAELNIPTINTGNAEITASALATFCATSFSANKVEIQATANCKVTIDGLKADNLEIISSSNSIVSVTGSATNCNFIADSNGSIHANGLKYDKISQDTASNGKIKL